MAACAVAVLGAEERVVTAYAQGTNSPFMTTWKTTSVNETITIPTSITSNYTVDWGDGTASTHIGDAAHMYDAAGNHTVRISGNFEGIFLNEDAANAEKLVSIDQWGDVQWKTMNGAFYRASNMIYNATDAPDLSEVTDMSNMFASASSFDGDLSDWDVSRVKNMSVMFWEASSFNGSISTWDVSRVTDMSEMFRHASSFDGDISAWNVSGVESMYHMFYGARSFNGDISGWDVSGVTDMSDMFHNAFAFRQNLGNWYIVLNGTSIDSGDAPGLVGRISAQNQYLDNQNSTYVIGAGPDSNSFEIVAGSSLNMTVSPDKPLYVVNITSTGSFGTSNHRVYSVTLPNLEPSPTNPVPAASFGSGDSAGGKTFDELNSAYHIATAVIGPDTYALITAYSGDGVQIVNITDPASPVPVASFDEGDTAGGKTFDKLDGARGIATVTIGPGTYALVAASNASGVQIVDITDPANPVPAASFGDGDSAGGKTFDELEVPFGIATATIGSGTYALVSAYGDDGVQIVDITDPANPVPAASFGDGDTAGGKTFDELKGAEGITAVTIGHRTYALVAAYHDDGVQIVDITDPASPVPAASFGDGGSAGGKTFDKLRGPYHITTIKIGSGIYALVTAYRDGGVQIIDITDPANPVPAASFAEGDSVGGKTFDELQGAAGIATVTIGPNVYAVVAGQDGYGVQIIDITDPANPVPAASFAEGDSVGGKIFDELSVPRGVATVTIGSNAYALVAASLDDAVQIIDLGAVPAETSAPRTGHAFGPPDGSFGTTWQTASAGETINIPVGGATGNYTVHWGDGTASTHTGDASHMYDAAGNHAVSISGDFTRIFLAEDTANAEKLVSIDQWGNVRWQSMSSAFYGASNMIYIAIDEPDLSRVTDMSYMFYGASSFNGNLSGWNVSSVTRMDHMFEGAPSFNQPLNDWNVSSVTGMDGMFSRALDFSQNLGDWYIVLNSTSIDASGAPGVVGTISAQNPFLRGQNATYAIESGGNEFEIVNGTVLNMTVTPTEPLYAVTINSTGGFGDNNHRAYNVTVTGAPIGVTDGTPPEILAARATARNAITVTFSEDVDADSTDGSGWSITGNDAGTLAVQSNTDPAGSSSTMNLTLSENLTDTAPDLSLAYAAPATGGITDTANPANPLGNQTVEVGDGIPPVVESARATSPTGITLTMSEIVNSSGTGPNGFAVSTTGTAVTVSSIGGSNSGTLVLTLSGSISDADTITVSYGTGDVRDLASNPLAGFSGRTVDTSTDITPPTFVSATYSTGNGSLVITFSEPIGGTANLSKLHVRESGQSSGGATLTGASQSVSGSTLTVTLTAAQQTTLAGLTTPQLDIDAGAVSDANSNGIDASADNAITVDDTTKPTFVSATYSTGNGSLTITFSETVSSVDYAKLHVRGQGAAAGGITLGDVTTKSLSGAAITATLDQAQRTAFAGLATPQLDIDAGAVSDANSNGIDASADRAITVDDTTPPTFVSATYSTGNGSLTITFSETVSSVDYAKLHVRGQGAAAGGITLGDVTTKSLSGAAITATLDQAQRTAIAGLTTPQLDIDAGAVSDANDNDIAASADRAITVDDTTPPTFVSATYSTGNGSLTITFSETVSSVDYAKLHVRGQGAAAGGITLGDVTTKSLSGAAITATLDQAQRTAFAGLTTPQLDIDAGAVSDANGNGIDASADNAITVDDTVPPTVQSAKATAANTIVVTFSENVDAGAVNGAGWSLSGADAGNLTVTSNTDPGGSSDALTLTLSGSLQDTAPDLILTYAVPASGASRTPQTPQTRSGV